MLQGWNMTFFSGCSSAEGCSSTVAFHRDLQESFMDVLRSTCHQVKDILKSVNVKIHNCLYSWKGEVELVPWDRHHNQLNSGPFDKHCHGSQSYDPSAENLSGNWYDMGNIINPICRCGQHYYFQHAHPLLSDYRKSWKRSVYLFLIKSTKELTMAHISLSGVLIKKMKPHYWYVMFHSHNIQVFLALTLKNLDHDSRNVLLRIVSSQRGTAASALLSLIQCSVAFPITLIKAELVFRCLALNRPTLLWRKTLKCFSSHIL